MGWLRLKKEGREMKKKEVEKIRLEFEAFGCKITESNRRSAEEIIRKDGFCPDHILCVGCMLSNGGLGVDGCMSIEKHFNIKAKVKHAKAYLELLEKGV